ERRRYPPARMFASYGQNGVVMRGDWDMTTFAWDSEPNGSLENGFSCTRIPPSGQNFMRYCSADVDLLLWRFTMTYDEDGRRRLDEQIERRLIDAVPAINLFSWKQGYAFSPRLQNYEPGTMVPLGDLMKLDI
ncbi:MAG TPA: hypothetical protein VKR05_02825, partial [Candidatus Cybelea sp.]|nr:hypothetical protein [Candidatus Cybelea sp.]